jgi:hypothetical protein
VPELGKWDLVLTGRACKNEKDERKESMPELGKQYPGLHPGLPVSLSLQMLGKSALE